jgi:hypothetical protein
LAFFDIGINVNVNIGPAVANVNSLIAALQKLQAMGNVGAQASVGLNSLNQSIANTNIAAQSLASKAPVLQNFFQVFTSGGQQAATTLAGMRNQFTATVAPVEQLGVVAGQLGTQFTATVAPIVTSQNALRQFSGQLQQTSVQFGNAERSGNRLAELFRGNRGLVFGLSSFFGTLTGIIFEMQLFDDANKQVAASQAQLNQLIAEGKTGSAQYSQAQQALGKDQRFLEFATRNLALAFTNLVPDTILIANGILSLRDKVNAARPAVETLAGTARVAGTELATVGGIAATSATPLGKLGVVGRTAAAGMTEGAVAAGGLRTALVAIGGPIAIILAVAGAIAALALAFQPLIQNAQAADPVYRKLMGVQDEVAKSTKNLADNVKVASDGMETNIKNMVDDIAAHYQKLIADTLHFSQDIKKASQGDITVLGPPAPEITTRGLTGGTSTIQGNKPLSQADLRALQTGKPADFIGPIPQKQPPPPLTPQQEQAKINAEIQARSAKLLTEARQPGEVFANLPPQVPLTMDMFSKFIELNNQRAKIMDDISKRPDKQATDEESLQLASLNQRIQDVITGKEELAKITKDNEKATRDEAKTQRDAATAYREVQQGMDKYNQTLDKMPLLLQDTGGWTKLLSDAEKERQNNIRDGAAVFVGYANAQKLSLGVAEEVWKQGKQLTDGLIHQRDAIAATNILWDNTNTIIPRTNQTIGEFIQKQQELIFSSIDVTKALTNQAYNQYLVGNGYIQAKLDAQQFLDTTIQGAVRNREYAQSLLGIADTLTGQLGYTLGDLIPADAELTNSELELLIKNFIETGQAGETLANIMNSRLADAFDTLNGVIHAEDKKAFSEEFKKFDFGTLGKDATNAFKQMDKDMNAVAKQGEIINNIIDHLRMNLNSGDFKESTLRQGLEAINDAIAKIGEHDPTAKFLKPYTEFIDSLDKGERAQVIRDHGDAINYLADAISDGDLTPLEVIAFYEKFGVSVAAAGGDVSKATQIFQDYITKLNDLKDAADKAEKSVSNVKEIIIGSGGHSVTVKPDHPLTEEEYQKQVQELNKKGVKPIGGRPDNPPPVTTEQQKMIDELNKNVPVAAQKAQTSLANLATQGVRSLTMLAQGSSGPLNGLKNNLNVGYVAAGHLQVGIANLANQGLKSLALLAAASSTAINGLRNNMNVGYVAAGHLQVGIANLDNEGSKSLLQLAQNSSTAATGMKNNFNVAYVAAGHLQVGLANLDNEGSASIKELASNITSALSKVDSKMASTESKVKELAKAFIALAAAAKKAQSAMSGGSGGGSSGSGNQHGLHTTLNADSWLFAHRGERVDIDTVGATQSNKATRASGGGDTTIHLTVNTINQLDGETIGTTVTRKTFRRMSTR